MSDILPIGVCHPLCDCLLLLLLLLWRTMHVCINYAYTGEGRLAYSILRLPSCLTSISNWVMK